jgi:hypothetical protein
MSATSVTLTVTPEQGPALADLYTAFVQGERRVGTREGLHVLVQIYQAFHGLVQLAAAADGTVRVVPSRRGGTLTLSPQQAEVLVAVVHPVLLNGGRAIDAVRTAAALALADALVAQLEARDGAA